MANKIVSVNATTGEETVRDLTDEEETQFAADKARWAEEAAAREAEEAARAAAKASGNAKLKELGLTDDEIAAL
jgi:hypothetical protein